MDFVREAEKRTPVKGRWDVVVVGGGPSGCAAAVGAARAGARVVLVELQSFLGGLATGGTVLQWPGFPDSSYRLYGDFACQCLKMGEEMKGVSFFRDRRWVYGFYDPEILKYVFQSLVTGSEAELLQHAYACGVATQDNGLLAVIVESKSGRMALEGSLFVDCTGDADLLGYAGLPWRPSALPISFTWNLGNIETDTQAMEETGFFGIHRKTIREAGLAHVDLPYPMPNRNVVWCGSGVYFSDIDPLDIEELTRIECEARRTAVEYLRQLRREPGQQDAFIFHSSTIPGVRASRQTVGCYVLTLRDMLEHRRFPDSIGVAEMVYHPSVKKGSSGAFEIPLGALIPQGSKNLLVAGRSISVEPSQGKFSGALEHVRGIPCCTVTGFAAGVAAALSVRDGVQPASADCSQIQQQLTDLGQIVSLDQAPVLA